MTPLQFEVFVTVVETGSFTRAGEILNLTQSGVSHAIASLEAELDIPLLNRSRRGISLTDAGERLIKHIRNVLHHLEHIKQEAAAIKGLEIGTIKIGCFPSVSAKLLPGMIGSFRKMHPNIKVELQEGGYDDIHHWIGSGMIDLGFVPLPNLSFETIALVKDNLMVLLPENHPLKNESAIRVEQIYTEPFIMPKAGCESLVTELFRSAGLTPNTQFEIGDNNTVIAMVQEGLGITIMPEMALPNKLPSVCIIPLIPQVHRKIGLAVRSLKTVSPAVKTFIQQAKIWVNDNHSSSFA